VPIVDSITPTSGPISGGTRLTIQGLEFAESTDVFFGNAPASDIAVVDDTVITATTPPCRPGPVPVILRGPDGTQAASPVAFTYVEEPSIYDEDGTGTVRLLTVDSIYPASGPVSGGTRMTIQGNDFFDGTAVFFGAAAYDVVVNNTVITAKTPPGTPAQVTVMLRDPYGIEALAPGDFTYLGTAEDTDGDGVTDAQESAGWTIAVDA
jgi:hypothetical protein